MELQILEENQDYIVFVKPAGTAAQTARVGSIDCVSILRNRYAGTDRSVHIINRLDQSVEGIMLCALNAREAARLSDLTKEHRIHKTYLAEVINESGTEIPDEGILTDHLVRDGRTNMSHVTDASDKAGKKAELSYRVLHRKSPTEPEEYEKALLEIRLKTGRHHQIRVQLSSRGWPIEGDSKYGSAGNGADPGRGKGRSVLHLTSAAMSFTDRKGQLKEYTYSPSWLDKTQG